MLVALLVDVYVDRLFAADAGADDSLAYRRALKDASPALRALLDLCAMHPDGPQLVIEAVEVPLADYGQLPVHDFMVSLYNDHTVQRVRVAFPDGARRDAHELLAAAISALPA